MPAKVHRSDGFQQYGDAAGHFRQSVKEADIDWLLCVELNTNRGFQAWVGKQVLTKLGKLCHMHAWRSVPDNKGESDLIWFVKLNGSNRVMAVLVENKIGAASQPRQYYRYLERGQEYKNDGKCDEFVVVLVAPEKYKSKDADNYQMRLSYEQVRDWFAKAGSARSRYVAWLFDLAIKKLDEAAEVDDDMFYFRRKVWELASDEFPHLNVQDPREENVSRSRYMVYMRTGGCILAYKPLKKNGKFFQCVVDLELRDRDSSAEKIEETFSSMLDGTDISVCPSGSSVAFRRVVPFVAPPDFDEERVRYGLRAASELLEWWRRVTA